MSPFLTDEVSPELSPSTSPSPSQGNTAPPSRWLSKQIKLPMSQPESLHISKVTIIQFCHPSRQTTHARQLCVIIAPSEALNEWSPHHPHPC